MRPDGRFQQHLILGGAQRAKAAVWPVAHGQVRITSANAPPNGG
jgi:hypothetical protein